MGTFVAWKRTSVFIALFLFLTLIPSLCTSDNYQQWTGNSYELPSEVDGADRFVSSSLNAPGSHDAELSFPLRSVEVALDGSRLRRSAPSSVGDVSDQRRTVALVTRHHQQQQQQQQVPTAGQQVAQPTIPKVAWQHRERNKQARLFLIQTQIMNSLRLTSRPNVTNRLQNLSDEEITTWLAKGRRGKTDRSNSVDRNDDANSRSRSRSQGRPPHGVRHQSTVVRHRGQQGRREEGQRSKSPVGRTFVLLPTCTVPSRLKGSRFFTPSRGAAGDKALRLYFNTDILAVSGLTQENNQKGRDGGDEAGDGALRVNGADLHLYWRGQSEKKWRNRTSVEFVVNGTSNRASVVRTSSNISDDGMPGVSNESRPHAAAFESSNESSVRGVRGIRGVQGRRMRRQAPTLDGGPTVQVAVYQLSSTSSGGARRRISRDDDTAVVSTPLKSVTLKSLAKSRWVKFNVTSAVDEWIKNPNKNFGLQVVVTGKPSSSVNSNRRGSGHRRRPEPLLSGLDGYDCGDQRDWSTNRASGERHREVNSTTSGSRRRTRPHDGDLDHVTLASTSYPKLEVSVVRVSVPEVSPSGERRRTRGDRRTHRRRNPRYVDDDVSVTSSASCDLQHLDVSLQDFSWSEMMIVQPLKHRFTYCDTDNPCPDKTTQSSLSAEQCCESVERDPLSVTYRDNVKGVNTTFTLANSNVIECRIRYVNNS